MGELVAAFVSMALGNQWGVLTMASGLVQGVGAEAVFAAFRWKRFTGVALYGAAALAGAFSILLDTFAYSYYAAYTGSRHRLGCGLLRHWFPHTGGACHTSWVKPS